MGMQGNGEMIDEIIRHFKLIRSWIREDDLIEVSLNVDLKRREITRLELGNLMIIGLGLLLWKLTVVHKKQESTLMLAN